MAAAHHPRDAPTEEFCPRPSHDQAGSAPPIHGETPLGTERDAKGERESDPQPGHEGVETENGNGSESSPSPPPTAAGQRSYLLPEGHRPHSLAQKNGAAGGTEQTVSGYGSVSACDPSHHLASGGRKESAIATGCSSASEATESVASGTVASGTGGTASAATGTASAASESVENASAGSARVATGSATKANATLANGTAATVTAGTATATHSQ